VSEELPPCGHPQCAWTEEDREQLALARSLGFEEIQPGVLGVAITDPAQFLEVMKIMTAGIEGAAQDVIVQAEELARRAGQVAEKLDRNRSRPIFGRSGDQDLAGTILAGRGGRHAARRIGRRAFWQEVKRWLPFRRGTG
jgi:hypothetical protein